MTVEFTSYLIDVVLHTGLLGEGVSFVSFSHGVGENDCCQLMSIEGQEEIMILFSLSLWSKCK